ncbi:SDR family oxidoreductase [Psychrobium sp. 1_MG-2023]|uniref:SDR family oxidoreductase n=1 Tax=Psychrobium sp. 1_MG-2023 TaxID=3062624 RepID=UPI000C337968|nr:SDR family NAD(P)-dependent oxidoreductase [Psychrobium sp. 1_MG-2023]MDP2560071.1 SDR family NAD(P)-dependent oxidoreductase [Psychrobium sp. 1_MG-2023]PKF56268.1 short-chain dehydrogenase [Alteromonadales bacterium alter-6D02]
MFLKNKKIVITGGTSGIGYQLVKKLSKDNALIVIGKDIKKLQSLKLEFEHITTYQADLSNLTEVKAIGEYLNNTYPTIDVLINNAAVQYTPKLTDVAFCYDTIAREINLNFTSICSLCYLLLPTMTQQSSTAIININSGLALTPKTHSAIYCGTKGALNIFSQSLRYQLSSTNIEVYQAFLPVVDTQMTYGRGHGKISASVAADRIISGIKRNVLDNYIGKVTLLKYLMQFAPFIGRRILKNA